jgi:hypothetical protein
MYEACERAGLHSFAISTSARSQDRAIVIIGFCWSARSQARAIVIIAFCWSARCIISILKFHLVEMSNINLRNFVPFLAAFSYCLLKVFSYVIFFKRSSFSNVVSTFTLLKKSLFNTVQKVGKTSIPSVGVELTSSIWHPI